MFDKIEAKVEEIRKQPETIRMKYVWGALIISMLIIIFIWLMSMKTNFLQMNDFEDTKTQESLENIQQQIQNISTTTTNQKTMSIDELLEQNPTDLTQ